MDAGSAEEGRPEALGQAEGGQSGNPEGLGPLGSEPSSNTAAPLVGPPYSHQPSAPDRMSLPPHWTRLFCQHRGIFSDKSLDKGSLSLREFVQ